MKKLFLTFIGLMLFSIFAFSQNPCPAPVTNFNFTFAKPVVLDQKVGGAKVCDPDVGQIETWSITSGNTPVLWKMVASGLDGNILVSDPAAINSSASTVFNITIKVQDNGTPPLSTTATVTLTDLNTAPAISNQTFNTTENSINGTVVGNVVATDINTNQTKTFSILSGNINGAFAINSATGQIVIANSLAIDYEVSPFFVLVVKVQDNGTGSLSAQANITVNLADVNEAPVINNQTFK